MAQKNRRANFLRREAAGFPNNRKLSPATTVATPHGCRLVRTQPWLDLAAVVWCGHGRGRTSQSSLGVDTAVAGPRDRHLA